MSTGLIATPASYYSTGKARYLGTKYKDNLDRLAARIARNSTTAELQFANNISSVGGIGFFTHSATKTADERYLEVVLATPETFEAKGEYSEKVNRLFSRYGQELLGVLAGDTQIYQDKELSGYGLNLTWRAVAEPSSNRVTLARAIIYFQKDRVFKFLQRQLSQQDLLRDAVIFAMEEDGPLNLVSYQPRESTADFRPAIREDNLTDGTSQASSSLLPSSQVAKVAQQNEPQKAPAESVSRESGARAAANAPVLVAEKPEVKAPPAALNKDPVQGSRPADSAADQIALTERPARMSPVAAVPEVKSEPIVAPQVSPTPAVEPSLEVQKSEGQINEAVKEWAPGVKTRASVKSASDVPVVPPRKVVPKTEPTKEETEKVAQPVLALKPSADEKTVEKIKEQESVSAPAVAPLLASGATVESAVPMAPVPEVARLENRQPVLERAAPPHVPAPWESENTTQTNAFATTSEPQSAEAWEAGHPRTDLIAPATAKVNSLRETKRADPAAASLPAAKTVTNVITPEPAKSLEVKRAEATSGRAAAEKLPDSAAAAKIEPLAREVAKVPSQVEAPTASAVHTAAPEPAVLPRIEPEIAMRPEVKSEAVPAARLTTEKAAEVAPARKVETATPAAVAKVEPQTTKPPSVPSVVPTFPENAVGKNAPEQLALLRKPPEPAIEKKSLTRQAPRSLEGFIIQIAFNDKEKAQGWAEKMAQRGYAVSVTEAGAEGALRVRLGNFTVRDEAERQLRNFKQEGMSGIIINLPLAFRPEARVSVP